MKNAFRALVLLSLTSITMTVLNAQSTPESIWGPAQYISNAEFQRMVNDGTLTEISPDLILRQDLGLLLRDLKNRKVVAEYLRLHPNLTQLGTLVSAHPTGRNVVRTADGNYMIKVPNADGTYSNIETMGDATNFENIANSMRASQSQEQQLALYRSLYDGYSAFFGKVCTGSSVPGAGGPPPGCSNLPDPAQLTSPAELADSSLPAIQRALETLGFNAKAIIGLAPLQSFTLSCAIGIPGSSAVANEITVGDMTNSNGCKTAASDGIAANFNWVNRNLLSPVKAQGARGVCHIFGATSAMEEIVARDTGCIVNLSEQDFLEHTKITWGAPQASLFVDGGDPGGDLDAAAANAYRFAWENQWDYNPSYYRIQPSSSGPPNPFAFANSCKNYPYPQLEPGCSNTTPQAPVYCTTMNNTTHCAYGLAALTGQNSPFIPSSVNSFWNPGDTDTSFDYILLNLAFNSAVMVAFNVTKDFTGPTDGYVPYVQSDLPTSQGGHAVHVVGYIDNSDLAANPATASAPPGTGGGYLVVKNSWGACSGDVGYYYVPVAHFEAEIQAAYALTQESH